MDAHGTIQHDGRKRLMHTVLAVIVIAVAGALLVYMITVEDEPGALPLLLLAVGIGWLAVARLGMRPRRD